MEKIDLQPKFRFFEILALFSSFAFVSRPPITNQTLGSHKPMTADRVGVFFSQSDQDFLRFRSVSDLVFVAAPVGDFIWASE